MAYVVLCCMPHLCCTGLHAAWRMLCCVAQGGDLSDHFDKKRPLTPEMSRCGPRTGKATVGLHAGGRLLHISVGVASSPVVSMATALGGSVVQRAAAEAAHRHRRLGLAWLDKVKERPLLYLVWVTEQVASEFY